MPHKAPNLLRISQSLTRLALQVLCCAFCNAKLQVLGKKLVIL